MNKYFLLLMCLLVKGQSHAADVKLSQLPLASASGTSLNDSFPFVDFGAGQTKRLTLWDLPNLPGFSSKYAPLLNPTFTGVVTAPSFVGALTGNSTTSTTAANLSGSITESQVINLTSDLALKAPLESPTFTGTVTAPSFVGALTGNSTTSTTAANLSGSITESQVTNLTSDLALKAPLESPTFTGVVTAPSFAGDLTGNATTATDLSGTKTAGTFYAGPTSGSDASPTFRALQTPTIKKYTSGSGTYTPSAGVLYIRVRMVGGGAGGCGSGSAAGTAPIAGEASTFGSSLLTANGGAIGSWSTGAGGSGGSTTVNSPAYGISFSGSDGGPQLPGNSSALLSPGAMGGASFFGGAGRGGQGNSAGNTAKPNSGSGGGGGGISGVANGYGGPAGAAGGYIDAIINSPSATYSYEVGSGGAAGGAGTGGRAGGAGAAGMIIVEEFYQ